MGHNWFVSHEVKGISGKYLVSKWIVNYIDAKDYVDYQFLPDISSATVSFSFVFQTQKDDLLNVFIIVHYLYMCSTVVNKMTIFQYVFPVASECVQKMTAHNL